MTLGLIALEQTTLLKGGYDLYPPGRIVETPCSTFNNSDALSEQRRNEMKNILLKTSILAFAIVLTMGLCIGLSACGGSEEGGSGEVAKDGNTLVYGSGDYTRINPAIDEHGEINLLLFDGLMGHDENNQVVPDKPVATIEWE